MDVPKPRDRQTDRHRCHLCVLVLVNIGNDVRRSVCSEMLTRRCNGCSCDVPGPEETRVPGRLMTFYKTLEDCMETDMLVRILGIRKKARILQGGAITCNCNCRAHQAKVIRQQQQQGVKVGGSGEY